jgi:cobalt/nickel transport system ATP-binding protein
MSDTAHSHDHASHTHTHAEPPAADEVVRVSCVRHSYEDGTSVYLCGIDFVASRGTRTVLLGPNGSGKTTLIYHVLGLLRAQEGTVRVFGVDPAADWPAVRQRIGVVLQNVDEQLLMPTVADDVAFSPRQYGLPEAEVQTRVSAALELLGISELADRVPHDLSGGEKRKVALAGALVMEPQLLVLDEPFEGLDPSSRRGLVELIERLAHEQGVTVVMSTHDIDSVAELADYVYALKPGGEIALRGTPEEVFAHADQVAASNIKPPILAELFAGLRARDDSAPDVALTVDAAIDAISEWKRCETPS